MVYFMGALLVVALIVAGVFAYGMIDSSVSLDYVRQQQQSEKKRSHLLSELLHKTSARLGRSELMDLIKRDFGNEHIIKEEKDRVLVDDVVIRFEGQTVIGVTTLDDVTE